MVTNQIGAGDVPIVIDGQDMVLKPTWAAAQAISRTSGGIMGAIDRVMKLDTEMIINIIQLGLGYGMGKRPPPDLAEKIWRSGFTDETGAITERCVTYLRTLANGGRPPSDIEDGGDKDGEHEAGNGKDHPTLNP